jgi:hypothetical protein
MKEKLLELIWELNDNKYPDYNKKADEIFRLFVAWRSEELLAFKKWEAENCKLPYDADPEQIIEQYLSQ